MGEVKRGGVCAHLEEPLKSWCLPSARLSERGEQTFPPTRKMAAPLLEQLSESLGSPEPAIRLILSILIGEFLLAVQLQVLVVARGRHTHLSDRCECSCWIVSANTTLTELWHQAVICWAVGVGIANIVFICKSQAVSTRRLYVQGAHAGTGVSCKTTSG